MVNHISRIWGIHCTSLESSQFLSNCCAEGSRASTLLSDVSGSAQLITGCLRQAEPGLVGASPKSNRKKSVILHKGYSLECSVCQKKYTVFCVCCRLQSPQHFGKQAGLFSTPPLHMDLGERKASPANAQKCGSLNVRNAILHESMSAQRRAVELLSCKPSCTQHAQQAANPNPNHGGGAPHGGHDGHGAGDLWATWRTFGQIGHLKVLYVIQCTSLRYHEFRRCILSLYYSCRKGCASLVYNCRLATANALSMKRQNVNLSFLLHLPYITESGC